MRPDDPYRRSLDGKPSEAGKPKIWASGKQRPPFDFRACGLASLHLSRVGVAPLHAWAARRARRVALNVRNGAGRIPEAKLGRFARFVPSHLRVAAWIKNLAAVLSHASATADPDVQRGNALVTEIEPHLWDEPARDDAPKPPEPAGTAAAGAPVAPVVLAEPVPPQVDPLASIRVDLGENAPTGRVQTGGRAPDSLSGPPAPPGPLATTAIQVSGYLIGWATTFIALPYGLARALWLYLAKSQDLRLISREA
jgi:hypothetical protein